MKLLKINEVIKNIKLLKHLVLDLLLDINKITKLSKSNNIRTEEGVARYYKVELINMPDDEILHNKILKLIEKHKKKIFNNDVIMSYSSHRMGNMEFGEDFEMLPTGTFHYNYILYFKTIHTTRVKPNKILYHFSPTEKRQSILDKGLIPMKSEDSERWADEKDLAYPPAVFCFNDDVTNQGWHYVSKIDVWEIDTTKIPNKWWEDINNRYGRTDLIMTFEPIPPQFIKLHKSMVLKPLN
jgi:hypothetical protein